MTGKNKTNDLQDQDRESRHQDQDFENWVSRRLKTKTQVSRTLKSASLLCETNQSIYLFINIKTGQ